MRLSSLILGSLFASALPLNLAVSAHAATARDGAGCTYFVAPHGSDRNDGRSATTPLASLSRAQDEARRSRSKVICLRAGTYDLDDTLTLTEDDSGETWSYYAPDGVNSAVLDGRGRDVINIVGASGITIDGLKLQNGDVALIHVLGGRRSNGIMVRNCDIGFTRNDRGATTAGILVENATNSTIAHNFVHDTTGQGISLFAYTAGTSIDGDRVTGNVVLRAGQADGDIGAIYTNMFATGLEGGHVTIAGNFIRDTGVARLRKNIVGIYLDDNSSNIKVAGNVVGPPAAGAVNRDNANFTGAFLVHNGANNTISGNIVDLGASGMVATVNWAQDKSNLGQGMPGNRFTNNIVISSFPGPQQTTESGITGHSYFESMNYTAPAPRPSDFAVADNLYFNYAGGQVRTDGSVIGDAHPILADPKISDTYSIAGSSPAFRPPVNFTPIVGGWGPPGFVVPPAAAMPWARRDPAAGRRDQH